MRSHEFIPVRYIPTPAVTNAPVAPVTSYQQIPVVPDAVKHQRWQQMKAAELARSASQIQPTEIDLAKAEMMYADQQRQVNKDYERQSRRLRRDAMGSVTNAGRERRHLAAKIN
jgi:hypothetical protein